MHLPLLNDLLVMLGLAIGVTFLANRARIPAVVALLVTGVLAGPGGFGLVKSLEDVEVLAEVGIILLLFNIGVEFSLEKLMEIRRVALAGGAIQMGVSALIAGTIAFLTGLTPRDCLIVGGLVALSSTAVVLKELQVRSEVDAPHGRTSVGILLFQDIAAIPMILAVPFMAGSSAIEAHAGPGFVRAVLILVGIAAAAKWIIPRLLFHAARSRDREVFVLTVVFLLLGIAWLTAQAGLSLALGAFAAGLILSDSDYSHEAVAILLPFGYVFLSFFFIAMGMLVNPLVFVEQPGLVLGLTLGVIALKTMAGFVAVVGTGYPWRTALMTGLALAQVGEFSFILAKEARSTGLISPEGNELFLAVSILTMMIAPFLIASSRAFTDFTTAQLVRLRGGEAAPERVAVQAEEGGHLIIVGYGIGGRNVARAAQAAGIPYVVVEMNPATVRAEKKKGTPMLYGDATKRTLLEHLGAQYARALVIAVSDPAAARRIVQTARHLNPALHIIVRTNYIRDSEELHRLGADEVISAEYESAIEIFTRVLKQFLVPEPQIRELLGEIRSEGYRMLRGGDGSGADAAPEALTQLRLPEMDVATFQVPRPTERLADFKPREQFGVNLLTIRRGGRWLTSIDGDTRLHPGDLVIVLGSSENLSRFGQWLERGDSALTQPGVRPEPADPA